MSNFDFISTADKPALLAFSTPEWLDTARTALAELGYKVHTAATHGDQRRHAAVLLFGDSFQTFTPMQAFQFSVHAVINSSELFLMKQLIEKAIADNTLFLHSYREAQARLLTTERDA